jgi:hypothetical protein
LGSLKSLFPNSTQEISFDLLNFIKLVFIFEIKNILGTLKTSSYLQFFVLFFSCEDLLSWVDFFVVYNFIRAVNLMDLSYFFVSLEWNNFNGNSWDFEDIRGMLNLWSESSEKRKLEYKFSGILKGVSQLTSDGFNTNFNKIIPNRISYSLFEYYSNQLFLVFYRKISHVSITIQFWISIWKGTSCAPFKNKENSWKIFQYLIVIFQFTGPNWNRLENLLRIYSINHKNWPNDKKEI